MEMTSSPASIPIRAVPQASIPTPDRSPAVPRSWMPRPAYVAITFVLLLTVGWGVFRWIGRQSQNDNEAELADLAGFETESPSLGTPETQSQLSSSPFGEQMSSRRATLSGAWLIGTIEPDEVRERIVLPPRVSQASAHGPLLR